MTEGTPMAWDRRTEGVWEKPEPVTHTPKVISALWGISVAHVRWGTGTGLGHGAFLKGV